MRIWFQIALGLIPAIIIFLSLTLSGLKKKGKDWLVHVIALSACTVAAVSLCVVGATVPKAKQGLTSEKQTELNLELAYAVASVGDFELADGIIDSMRASGAESSMVAECQALLYAAKGDAVSAKALLVKANMLEAVDDYDSLITLCDEAIAEDAVAMGSENSGKRGALMSVAADKISKKFKKSKVQDVAQALVDAEAVYQEFLLNDNLDTAKAADLANTIETACKKNSALRQIKEVRLCRLKLLVLSEDYSAIAQEISTNASFDELAIVAELYVNNVVTNKDFAPQYGKDYITIAQTVNKQLRNIEDKVLDESPEKKQELRNLIDRLDISQKSPAISRLKAELRAHADNVQSADRPKAYMQLARMEYTDGNDKEASQHISAALNTVGMSDDERFSTPMMEIVDSITDKENLEKVKNIAQYAEDVTKNSSDYIVVKSIEKAQQNAINGGGNAGNAADGSNTEDKRNPFEVFFADEASQKRNAFSITSVDASKFETVKLVVNVDPSISITAEELQKLIAIKDCGVNIENFTVEKVTYSGANIVLCCDTSGSMSGQPIEDLRNAVKQFVQSSSDIENIALVAFDSGTGPVYQFSAGKETIISAADSLYANGGTNMYGAVLESIQMFTYNENTLNFILLMSDGEDGVSPTMEQIENNVGAACKEKGITLFSLGLSSGVNVDYMNTFATTTGGYFVYINDSATMNDFYAKLRGQILNRYIITYEAKDTLRASRNVTVSLKDSINDNIVSDTKQYNMYGSDVDTSTDSHASSVIQLEGLSVSGLDTRRVYTNSNAITVDLLGTKFTSKMVFDIKLDGKLNYEGLAYEFIDEGTIRLTLPGGMACDTYDLVVNVDGKVAILPNELTVSSKEKERTTTFGNYIFTSDNRIDTENGVVLSGYVTMNGWLHFNGDVTITGDLNGYSIRVTDTAGSYIKYYKDSASGLAKSLANNNITIPIGPLGSFNIYNDTYSQGDSPTHRVDTVVIPVAYVYILECRAPGLEVYPDKIVVKSNGFTSKFPMQDVLLKASSLDDLYTFDFNIDFMLTNKSLDLKAEFNNKLTEDEESTYTNRVPANFGMMPIYTTPATYEVKINTNTNEYLIDFAVKVAFIDSEGIGLKMEWGAREKDAGLQFLIPKTVVLKSDFEIKSTLGTVPVTYRDFNIGLEDIDPNTNIFNWKLVGGFDLETTKLSSYIPGLKDYIGDPALLKLDDIKASLSLGQAYIGVECEGKFLEQITLGKLAIEAGKIPYTCELLGMYDQTAIGMKASLTAGIIWDTPNVDINLSGTGILNLHTRFFGIEVQGICDLEVAWWIFEKEFYQEGRALMGFMNDGNRSAFVIKARDTRASGSQEVYLYIDSDGVDCGIKKL